MAIVQLIIALILAGLILLQGGGAGLGSSWGGSGDSSFRSRRGMEKFLLYLTAGLAFAFFISSLISLLL
ncbi:preprotein translocase subunit SecG [Candidatus Roizmanbacteria bacterium CG22_combo_CG10-13_8_21_14_all_38_20]|uniref:Protein-export membrane protein SecG n=1 Tax=Candidatus Roizmanbacteria bacterium CG22_combo_CG10-13_8_21_14_all_38_20 TaxID=1974862 RepID=A0A2H0BX04_9BACT|nr:preprotein translocase subunit SecG [Candidatus Microgenomates bacterium]PIP61570.1 MAG: preprotein translocase subunit SecG [Candidatus Roizmanbacteria bacterium CG22_combo_CG10-13_8_21_14_all_38_20]PJC31524.1 MAG: preprotein translocase subunit SecG [Candidatus Roizmanbacteria bacterium CG_4_9_14_0_2_um_filter_38_17]